ncbi:MAG TPA: Abi family protein [Chitinophaga sp.]|uniref:Abi family protein n=1 Tax=Chitinophaga sp. TaxID=1869181 RepID=UPI002DBC34C9|nr:Abi family protein [Chitinophaga sp.]HEU4555189.1 Abi family protein [Chitinophaga sp.]
MFYTKIPTTIDRQIIQLSERGLIITDEPLARHYLANVSYYRLAGYWWPMQANKATHVFKPNSRFENVIALYNFDRELRLLVFDVIERIEIAQIRNICAHHGRLWNKNLPGRPNLMARPPRPWLTSVPPANEHHML